MTPEAARKIEEAACQYEKIVETAGDKLLQPEEPQVGRMCESVRQALVCLGYATIRALRDQWSEK